MTRMQIVSKLPWGKKQKSLRYLYSRDWRLTGSNIDYRG
jgi:hypothetical protein